MIVGLGGVVGVQNQAYSLDATTAAILARMSGTMSVTARFVADQMVRRLKAEGLWAKIDGFYPFFLAPTEADGLLNWKAEDSLTAGGDPTFTQGRGFTGDGVDAYLEAPYQPTDGQMTQNSAHLAIWSLSATSAAPNFAGVTNFSITTRTGGDASRWQVNSSSGFTNGTTNGSGFFLGSRTGSTAAAEDGYQDGVNRKTSGGTSTTPAAFNFRFLCLNGSSPNYSAGEIAFGGFGAGLTANEAAIYYGIMYEAMRASGVIQPVAISSPVNPNRIYALTSGDDRDFTVTGTYAGVASSIEARSINADTGAEIVAWGTLDAAPSGKAFTGTETVPAVNAWQKFQARNPANPGAVATDTNQFGVGLVILKTGQSNMARKAAERDNPPASNALTRRFTGGSGSLWYAPDLDEQVGEPTSQNGARGFGGNGEVVFANKLNELTSLPVAVIPCAVGGTSASQWEVGNTSWNNANTCVSRSNGPGWAGLSMAVHDQGETDAGNGTSGAAWTTSFENTVAGMRTQTGDASFPVLIGLLGACLDGTSDANVEAIRQAQLALVDSGDHPLAYCRYDLPLIDNFHYSAANYARIGRREALSVAYHLRGVGYSGAGPKIDAATIADGFAALYVSVTHEGGTGLTDASGSTVGAGLTGWEVQVDSSPVAISSTAFESGQIRLNLASTVSTGQTVEVRYMYGADPDIGNVTYDNTSFGDVVGLPLQPSRGWVAASVT